MLIADLVHYSTDDLIFLNVMDFVATCMPTPWDFCTVFGLFLTCGSGDCRPKQNIACIVVTTHIQSKREGTVFTCVCLLAFWGGGTPCQVGGYPIQGLDLGGLPCHRSWGGYPIPVLDWGYPPRWGRMGVPLPRSGWDEGYPIPGMDRGLPIPGQDRGYSIPYLDRGETLGYPPPWQGLDG